MHHHTFSASAVQSQLSSSALPGSGLSDTSPSPGDCGSPCSCAGGPCGVAHATATHFGLPVQAESDPLGFAVVDVGRLWWDALPPDSNTGGKSLVAAESGTPALQMGATPRYSIQIDTLTFSFSGGVFGFDIAPVRKWLMRWSGGVLTIGGKLRARYNGYAECWDIVPADGLDSEAPPLGWLGVSRPQDSMRGRWCFHLTGAGCACVLDWSRLVADAPAYFSKITRVDSALDDLRGDHSVSFARRIYDEGAFNLSGRPPTFEYIQTSHAQGDTFYVGKRDSGKRLRVYEKGREIAGKGLEVSSDSLSWVRWELELRAKDRRIPFDVLLYPAAYLKGAYPDALGWVSGVGVMLSTLVEKSLLSLDRMVAFAKRQVGRLVRYCVDHGLSADAIVDAVSAPPGQYPLRLFNPGVSFELVAAGAGGRPAATIF